MNCGVTMVIHSHDGDSLRWAEEGQLGMAGSTICRWPDGGWHHHEPDLPDFAQPEEVAAWLQR